MSFLYVVYDEVAELYTAPITLKNDAVAKRWFAQQMTKVNDPTDYKLYKVGEYDDNAGIITAASSPLLLETGHKVEEPKEVI